tara:strand:- start:386 stop:985 length:600 start_codon:yes stop_codon:yes gene_type:complete
MPIAINGSGSITGISAGGLPDGCVTADDLASGVGGKILAVSEALKKDTFSTQSESFVDITGLSVTMTPASTSSKFLVTYNVCFSPRDQHYSGGIRCVKVVGGTTTDDIYVGNAAGNRVRCSNFAFSDNSAPSYDAFQTQSGSFLHSPNTTSAVTFKMQCTLFGPYGYANDVFVNRTNTYSDTTYFGSPVSSITVLELSS